MVNEVPDFTGLRAAVAARREKQLPFAVDPITNLVTGSAGRVSYGGSWIGLAGVLVNPFVAAAFTAFLDVWLDTTDATGPATFSIPIGEKVTVPFSRFAWVLRVTGAPPFARLAILSGYDVAFAEWVPSYAFAVLPPATVVSGAVNATIVAPLSLTDVQTGPKVRVPTFASAAITDADSTPLAASATRAGGVLQNIDATNNVWIKPGAAAVANASIKLSPGSSYALDSVGWRDQVAWHAICEAGKTATLAIVTYA